MKTNDPALIDFLRRSMVARISTLSRNGRPNINPLYFIYLNGCIWLGTDDWTLAARNVKADPRVSVLFELERNPGDRRVLRITGQASVRTDPKIQRVYNSRVARKYILPPGGLLNTLTHFRQFLLKRVYNARNAEKGGPCVIEVIPEQIEFLQDDQRV